MNPITPRFWTAEGSSLVRCSLCPRGCVLDRGATGACRVRANANGAMTLPFLGAISSMSLDPIEKKPLFHFLPGTKVFSIGFLGCNLRCPFCQNWRISQRTDAPFETANPEDLVLAAKRSGAPSIAYTYSEPLVHAEFVIACAIAAKAAGLANVLVTNGTVTAAPAAEILGLMDAVNLDIKTWDPARYREALGGDLETTLAFARMAAGTTRLEVTTLVVPGLSDDEAAIDGIARFVESIDPSIPLHLSAYRPMYRFEAPATPDSLVASLCRLASTRLRFVYHGNVAGRNDTRCASCGRVLVERDGYSTRVLADSACPGCGKALPYLSAFRRGSDARLADTKCRRT